MGKCQNLNNGYVFLCERLVFFLLLILLSVFYNDQIYFYNEFKRLFIKVLVRSYPIEKTLVLSDYLATGKQNQSMREI